MLKKSTLFLVFLILISTNFYSQELITYNGYLTKEEHTITLHNLTTDSLFRTSSQQGHFFEFKEIPKGNYKRLILSNEGAQCDTIKLDHNLLNEIVEDSLEDHTLSEITIKAEKPNSFIQHKNGNLIITIAENNILNNGNALETISKLPGISYSHSNDSFRLNGKENIQVQLNNEQIFLNQKELTHYLKSLSADTIDHIEMIFTPSSAHDANALGGIINIITKNTDKKKYELTSFFSANQGIYHNNALNLRGIFNGIKNALVIRYNYADNNNFEQAFSKKTFSDYFSHQDTYAKIKGNTHSFDVTAMHNFKKSKLEIGGFVSLYDEKINQNTTLDFFTINTSILSEKVNTNQYSKNSLNNVNLRLKYDFNINSYQLIFRSYYLQYNIDNHSDLEALSSMNPVPFELDTKYPKNVNVFLSQLDIKREFDSLSDIAFGLKIIQNKFNNQNTFFSKEREVVTLDTLKSNTYNYRESILAGYLQYAKRRNKLTLKIGVRLEYINSQDSIEYFQNNSRTNDNHHKLNVFPNINIDYLFTTNHSFNFNFNSRINRPSYSLLIPSEYYVDPYTVLSGNPNLLPNISYNLDLRYILKNNYIFGVNFMYNQNPFYQIPLLDLEKNTTILKSINLDKSKMLSFFNNSTLKLTDYLNININTNLFYSIVSSTQNETKLNSNFLSYEITLNSSYTSTKKYIYNLSLTYTSDYLQGPYLTKNILNFNASIGKSFLHNKLRLSLIANDILNTYQITNILKTNEEIYTKQKFDLRWIKLGVLFNLFEMDKKQKKIAIDHNSEIDDLKNRIN